LPASPTHAQKQQRKNGVTNFDLYDRSLECERDNTTAPDAQKTQQVFFLNKIVFQGVENNSNTHWNPLHTF